MEALKVEANDKSGSRIKRNSVYTSKSPPAKKMRGALFKEISATMPIDSTRYLRVVRDAEDEIKDFRKLEKDNLRNSCGNTRKFRPNKKAARLEKLMQTTYDKYQLEIIRPSLEFIEKKHATAQKKPKRENHNFLKKTVRDSEQELFASFQLDQVRKSVVAAKSMWNPRQ